ncbi:MAG: PAS domain S-box protein [Methylococcales bacterium]
MNISTRKLLLSGLIPILAALIQWQLWPILAPKTWIFFYPAVFFSALIAGLVGGIIATCLSTLLGIYFFIYPQFTWEIGASNNYASLGIFMSMGLIFSLTFDHHLKVAKELQRLSKLEIDLQENRLKLALDSAQAGLWEWDVITNENFWSDKLWALYGLDPASCKPSYESWLSSVNPTDQITVEQVIKRAVKNGTALDLEWRVAQLFEGKERWLMAYGQPVLNERGELRLYRGIVIDISERKAMQIKLQDNEELLNFAMETIKAGIWILSLEDNTAKRTLMHDQIFGYDSLLPEWTFDKALDYVLPEDRKTIEDDFSKARANLTDWAFECRIRRIDGVIRWIAGKAAHKFNGAGKPVAMIGIIQDITERKEAEAKQRFEEIRYKAFVDQAAPDAMFVHDHNGDFIEVNWQACQSTGYSKQELLGMNVLDLEQNFNLPLAQAEWNRITPGETKTLQGKHRHKDGRQFPVEVNFGLLVFEGKRQYLALVRDITQRKRMEQTLQEKKYLLTNAQAIAHIGSWMVHAKTGERTWSEETFRLYGLSPETDKAPDWEQFLLLLHPDDRPAMQSWFDECLTGKQPPALEFRTRLIKGQYRWLSGIGHLEKSPDGEPWRMIGTVQDITERKIANDKVKAMLTEKEVLLKEVYHRVKNNLQIISSLVNLQAKNISNPETLIQLKQTADRVKAMALIHEKLYQSDDLAQIEFKEYIRSLLDHLLFSFGDQASHIKINTNIDNVLLNVDTAIPCGLIINELVSNALKHAFPENRPGEISITLKQQKQELVLAIEDNGINFPTALDFKKSNSLGLQLVTQLTAQLLGQITLDKSAGAKYTIHFNNHFPEKT